MKKSKLILSIIIVIFSLLVTSVGVKYYKEEREINALKSQAIYNAFGYNGYAYDAAGADEVDDYGRMVFRFRGYNEATFDGLIHCMICQYIDYKHNYVYYYPTDNILTYHTEAAYIFPVELVNSLKEKNDWNKEIDLSKCVKRKIDKYKENNFNRNEIESIFEEYVLFKYKQIDEKEINNNYYSKYWLLDVDKNGLELYAYKLKNYEIPKEEYVFALIMDSNDRSKYDIVEIFYDDTYNNQIANFKIKNNWTYDYCV